MKTLGPVASIALPIMFPGIGMLGSALIGAATGALSGGGLKGALIGGATGALGGGGGSAIAGKLGASGLAQKALGGAIAGGFSGAATGGGLKGAATGAALGGLTAGGGNYLAGQAGATGLNQQAIGNAAAGAVKGAATGGGVEGAITGAALGGASPYASNYLGEYVDSQNPSYQTSGGVPLPSVKPSISTDTGTASLTEGNPMNLGSLLSAGSDIYGYVQGQSDIDKMKKMYEQSATQAQAQFQPYAQAGTQALQNMQGGYDAFTQDPGYQFQLDQGNQALERSLAAQGMGQSGAALKAAQQYGQGLASQSYNDFYNRNAQVANQGFGAASGLGNILTGLGNSQANAQVAKINNRNDALSGLFGGGYDDNGNILQGSLGRLLSNSDQNNDYYNNQQIRWN